MRIRFKRMGSNTAIGGFSPGDTLTCGDALARHLVEEAMVAEYVSAPLPEEKKPEEKKPVKRVRKIAE